MSLYRISIVNLEQVLPSLSLSTTPNSVGIWLDKPLYLQYWYIALA